MQPLLCASCVAELTLNQAGNTTLLSPIATCGWKNSVSSQAEVQQVPTTAGMPGVLTGGPQGTLWGNRS